MDNNETINPPPIVFNSDENTVKKIKPGSVFINQTMFVSIFDCVVKEDLSAEMTFELSPK